MPPSPLAASSTPRDPSLSSSTTDYDLPRVRDLMRQYMSVAGGEEQPWADREQGGAASALYRMERGLRDVLWPKYAGFLKAMNTQSDGLKLLAVLRADPLALLGENAALRSLDEYLKEKLVG